MKTHIFKKSLVAFPLFASLFFVGIASADDVGKYNGLRVHGGDEVFLQIFHWNTARNKTNNWYKEIRDNADKVADLGVTGVWMSPPWQDYSSWADGGKNGGGEGYFWRSFSLDGNYGTEGDLRAAVSALKTNGVKAIFDFVPNHRAKDNGLHDVDGWYFPGPMWKNGGCDDGNSFSDDADVCVPAARDRFKDELIRLVSDIGGVGARFDFIHGYGWDHPKYWMENAADEGVCVGEWWASDTTHNDLKSWAMHTGCMIFDFELKARMTDGIISSLRWGMNANQDTTMRAAAATFIDNHDTGYSPGHLQGQHHWPTPGGLFYEQSYAYILTTPGTPFVYLPDVFNDEFEYQDANGNYIKPIHGLVKAAIAARKEAGVRAFSGIDFHGNDGLKYTVHGCKKLVASIGASAVTVNGVNGNYDPNNFTMMADGPWGKIWVENGPSCINDDITNDSGLNSSYPAMYVRHTSNDFSGANPMKLVDDHDWETNIIVGNTDVENLKFEITGNAVWGTNFGDVDANGTAEQCAANCDIVVTGGTGTYKVTLNDSNPASLQYTITKQSSDPNFNTPPVADAGPSLQVPETRNITFDGSRSMDADGDTLTYQWTCEGTCPGWTDGNTKEHTVAFTALGEYDIMLTVTDNHPTNPLSHSTSIIARVIENVDPKMSVQASMAVRGTANAWGATDMVLINDYTWKATLMFSNGINERFKFDVAGDWVTNYGASATAGVAVAGGGDIIVADGAGIYDITFNDSTMAYTIVKQQATNAQPIANAGSDMVVNEGDNFTLDGSASMDPDGTIVSYKWSNGLEGQSINVSYASAGSYLVTLTVQDNAGALNSDTVTITVVGAANLTPTANAGTDIVTAVGNNNVTFDGSGSSDSDGNISLYRWKLGAQTLATGVSPTVTIDEGIHVVTLEVTDDDGAVAIDSLYVTVNLTPNSLPVAVAGEDQVKEDVEQITLSAAGSYDSDGAIVSYTWKSGSMILSTDQIFTSNFAAGSHTITLEVVDEHGDVDTDDVVLTVTSAPQNTTVEFACNNAFTTTGWEVYIVGGIPELGDWDTDDAVRLYHGGNYPNWKDEIEVPPNTNIQWKCIKKNGASVVWQAGGNNVENSPGLGQMGTSSKNYPW